MSDWIFLSKGGQDEYINMMARGSGGRITNTDDFVYEHSDRPIVLRGILKHKIMQRCWQDHRDFYYVDTGYFGNYRPKQKLYHRIVKNDLQHTEIRPRPNDRWLKFNIKLKPRKHGSKVLLAMPDDKPCKFYGIDRERWRDQVISQLRSYSDRDIIIRERSPNREDRLINDPLSRLLTEGDIHAVVIFNSVAATESIICGVPAFVLAPSNAAGPVANTDLSLIEDPYWADHDQRYAWACHLAYGQFHVREIADGTAYRILNEN